MNTSHYTVCFGKFVLISHIISYLASPAAINKFGTDLEPDVRLLLLKVKCILIQFCE